jgi:outer membrane murein-binding lipoprotein Lpp
MIIAQFVLACVVITSLMLFGCTPRGAASDSALSGVATLGALVLSILAVVAFFGGVK